MSDLLAALFPRRAARADLSQLAGELWLGDPAFVESFLREAHAEARGLRLLALGASRGVQDDTPGFVVVDGVAHIAVRGPIVPSVPSWAEDMGLRITGSANTRIALSRAIANEAVKSIMLDIDSPGGAVSGLKALADEIAAADAVKPVFAHASGVGALSAAYWAGAGARRFTIEHTARGGSIGVLAMVEDTSAAAEKAGVKVHAVRFGKFKGEGMPGVPVSEATIGHLQEWVDAVGGMFVQAVAAGRGLDADHVRTEIAIGRAWSAEQAVALKLFDAVETQEAAHAAATIAGAQPDDDGEPAPAARAASQEGSMSEEELKALQARLAELETKVAAADADKAKAEALAEANAAQLAAVHEEQKSTIIAEAQAKGQIVPATLEAQKRLAAAYGADVDGFRKVVAAYPVITRAEPQSQPVTQTPDPTAASSADKAEIAGRFGMGEAELFGQGDVAFSFTSLNGKRGDA